MKPENRPKLEWRLRIVAPKHSPEVLAVLTSIDRGGHEVKVLSWTWPTGRPTPSELEDLAAGVTADVVACIVATIGLQGVLGV